MKSKFKRRKKYEDYQKLIYNLAHRFHRTTGIEFDELVGTGNLKFIECQKNYDPLMATFSTYLHIQIRGLFLEMHRKNIQANIFYNPMPEKEKLLEHSTPESLLIFKEILQRLSDDAKEVCKIIFSTPSDLISMIAINKQTQAINKNVIQVYLRWRQGWEYSRITRAFKEISQSLAF